MRCVNKKYITYTKNICNMTCPLCRADIVTHSSPPTGPGLTLDDS